MCPDLCNANGLCSSDSVCTCFPGYTGPACNLRESTYFHVSLLMTPSHMESFSQALVPTESHGLTKLSLQT